MLKYDLLSIRIYRIFYISALLDSSPVFCSFFSYFLSSFFSSFFSFYFPPSFTLCLLTFGFSQEYFGLKPCPFGKRQKEGDKKLKEEQQEQQRKRQRKLEERRMKAYKKLETNPARNISFFAYLFKCVKRTPVFSSGIAAPRRRNLDEMLARVRSRIKATFLELLN